MAYLAHLRSAAAALQASSPSSIDEDDLRAAITLHEQIGARLQSITLTTSPATAAASPAQPVCFELADLPPEMIVRIAVLLPTVKDVAHLACTCRLFYGPPHSSPPRTVFEEAMRERTSVRGGTVPLPTGYMPHIIERGLRAGESMAQALCWGERRDLFQRQRQIVAGGTRSSAFIDAEGRLLTCGDQTPPTQHAEHHFRGAMLGHGAQAIVVPVPTVVPGLAATIVRSVSVSDTHHLVLGEAGEVYSFGLGSGGPLGHGNQDDVFEPRLVEALQGVRVVAVAAGGEAYQGARSLMLSDTGDVYSCGSGWEHVLVPPGGRLVSRLVAFTDEDTPPEWDRARGTPRVIPALQGVKAIAVSAGAEHSLVLSEAGEVYSWGSSSEGKLGHGDCEYNDATWCCHAPRVIRALQGVRVVAVSAGQNHSLVLSEAGEVLSFGCGGSGRGEFYGMLGHGEDEHDHFTPRLIEALRGVRIVAVSAGGTHSLCLSEAGTVYSFGSGYDGQLGHGDCHSQLTPRVIEGLQGVVRVVGIAAGQGDYAETSFAVSEEGDVYGWGEWKGGESRPCLVPGGEESRQMQSGPYPTACLMVPLQYPNLRLSTA